MNCDFGPFSVANEPSIVIEIEYNSQPAFELLPDGRCKINQPALEAFAQTQVEPSERANDFSAAILFARAILAAGGWPTQTLESWSKKDHQVRSRIGLYVHQKTSD